MLLWIGKIYMLGLRVAERVISNTKVLLESVLDRFLGNQGKMSLQREPQSTEQ